MFEMHYYIRDKRVLEKRSIHLPRAGDRIHLGGVKYGKVTEVVRIEADGQRVNLQIEPETPNNQGEPGAN